MQSLAEVLAARGWRLSGSDSDAVADFQELARNNFHILSALTLPSPRGRGVDGGSYFVPVFQRPDGALAIRRGHNADQVPGDADLVIHSAAIPPNNPELKRAVELSLPLCSYPQMLGQLMCQRRGLAIAGTHGKSTTTAMAGEILSTAGFDPTVVVAARRSIVGNSTGRFGRGRLDAGRGLRIPRQLSTSEPAIGRDPGHRAGSLRLLRDACRIGSSLRASSPLACLTMGWCWLARIARRRRVQSASAAAARRIVRLCLPVGRPGRPRNCGSGRVLHVSSSLRRADGVRSEAARAGPAQRAERLGRRGAGQPLRRERRGDSRRARTLCGAAAPAATAGRGRQVAISIDDYAHHPTEVAAIARDHPPDVSRAAAVVRVSAAPGLANPLLAGRIRRQPAQCG